MCPCDQAELLKGKGKESLTFRSPAQGHGTNTILETVSNNVPYTSHLSLTMRIQGIDPYRLPGTWGSVRSTQKPLSDSSTTSQDLKVI